MKKLLLTIMLTMAIVITTFAQSPQAFKYQAVVRDNAGEIINNQTVSFRVSIRDISGIGPVVYQETRSIITNNFGLANLLVGAGTPVIGTFSDIDWRTNVKFMEVELDPAGGSNYVYMGTTQLLSVPFALYAEDAKVEELTDENSDTRITVEENPDEDFIRFYVAGNEIMKHDGKTLHMSDAISNVYIGNNAGAANTDGELNVALGGDALKSNTSGDSNIGIGVEVLNSNTAGNGNIAIGNRSLYKNISGFGNTALGSQAGYQNISGDNNVFLGKFAGYNETGNHKLYIENSQTEPEDALIFGDFDQEILAFDASVGIGTITPKAKLDVFGDIGINPSLALNNDCSGITSIVTIASNNLGPGAAMFMNSNGNFETANASNLNELPCVALAVEGGTGLKKVIHHGYFRNDNWNWIVSGIIYVDDDGYLTQVEHNGYILINQKVGYAVTNNIIMFNPDYNLYYKNNHVPVAYFEASPNPGPVNQEITFDASESYDPDVGEGIIQYEWDWDGDGSHDETTTNPIITHTFTEGGNINIGLRVTDNNQATGENSYEIVIVDCEPNGESCALSLSLGELCGDTGSENLSIQNCSSDWLGFYLKECHSGPGWVDITAQIILQPPVGVNYDLYLYEVSCNNLVDSSTNLTGQEILQITIIEDEFTVGDDSEDYIIEVRLVSGGSIEDWMLDIYGNTP